MGGFKKVDSGRRRKVQGSHVGRRKGHCPKVGAPGWGPSKILYASREQKG